MGTRPSNSDRGNEGNTKDDIKCHVNAAGMREKAPSDTACGSVQATHTEPEPPSQQQQQNTSHHTQTVNHLHSAPARRSPRHPTSHKSTNMNAQSSRTNKSTSSEPNHFLKLKKLRWSSLGYHYDWTNRTYYPKVCVNADAPTCVRGCAHGVLNQHIFVCAMDEYLVSIHYLGHVFCT